MDNVSSHKTQTIRNWFARRPRWHVHDTPTSASWISQVERFFANLTDKQIRRGVHRSTDELETATKTYIDAVNASPKPFVWTKSADDILASVKRFCPATLKTAENPNRSNFRIRTLASMHGYNMRRAWRETSKPSRTRAGERIERWPPVDGIFRRRMVVVDRRALPRWRISFVQEAVAAILTSIYEAEFLEFSYGFQPERGQHDAWMRSRMGWGSGRSTGSSTRISSRSFDMISHTWLKRFIEHRIGDQWIVRLIRK